MDEPIETFARIKEFVGFTAGDAENLVNLGPLFDVYGPRLTDAVEAKLRATPEPAPLLHDRVDALRSAYARWMSELFQGEYGAAYYERRFQIGLAHARADIAPHWCESVLSVVRSGSLVALATVYIDPNEFAAHVQSLCKILDLDQMIINTAYQQERLARLCRFTGMSRTLIERCIATAGKGPRRDP